MSTRRNMLEMLRPEIRQYFIEGDMEMLPFSRSIVYSYLYTFHRVGLRVQLEKLEQMLEAAEAQRLKHTVIGGRALLV